MSIYTVVSQARSEYAGYYETYVGSLAGKSHHNDDVDAFRHAYTSAVLAMIYGPYIAFVAGMAYEINGANNGQPSNETYMDVYNNVAAIDLANGATTKDQIAQNVANALANDQLIVDPNDIDGKDYTNPFPDFDFDDLEDLLPLMPDDLFDDPYEPKAQPDACPIPKWPAFLKPLLEQLASIFSPLVIDMDNDGIELTNITTNPVYWDYDNDGFKEAGAWITGGDALLVIDSNANGIIDNHSELFGTETVDGFTILSDLDTNNDNIIDNQDENFGELKIWIDNNEDGYSDADELQTLTEAGIVSINLDAVGVSYEIADNPVTHASSITMVDSSTRTIVDAWFKVDNQNSIYTEGTNINLQALFLPNLRGYGNLKQLVLQMSLDSKLLSQVQELAEMDLESVVDPDSNFDYLFKNMLYRWADQDLIKFQSEMYTGIVDFRKFKFVEAIVAGTSYGPDYFQGTLGIYQANFFRDQGMWEKIYTHYVGNFLVQTALKDLFEGNVAYDHSAGVATGITGISADVLEDIADLIDSSDNPTYGWSIIVRTVEEAIGIENLTVGDFDLLDDAIQTSLPGVDLEDIYNQVIGTPDDIIGTSGADTLTGANFDDFLYGENGNDVLEGKLGDDHLYGGSGNDTYIGGIGDDYYGEEGGNGDDIYVYDSGNDVIRADVYGDDKIVMADGITLGDISMERVNFDASFGTSGEHQIDYQSYLIIRVAGYGEIAIGSQYAWGSYVQGIETLEFDNLSTIDLTTLDDVVYGTSGADTMTGQDRSYYLRDILESGDGNDILDGGLGNDVLYGGIGNDTYLVGLGVDVVQDIGGSDDQIVFDNTYNPELFTFEFDPLMNPSESWKYALKIYYDGELKVVIDQQFASGSTNFIEKVIIDGVDEFDLASMNWDQYGTEGNDGMFVIPSSEISATLYGMGGDDTLQGGSKADHIEGGEGVDILFGYGNDDLLYGNAGNDTIDGGSGNDTMYGGTGDDLFIVDSTSDVINENADEGTDTVQSTVTLTLANNVENLTLMGYSAINATGNSLNNILVGNLNGDANILTGGTGDDTYVIDSLDTVVENASEGTDTVQINSTYTLLSNFENLTLTGYDSIDGTGNSANNILRGNFGTNTLTGLTGNDTYIVDSEYDVVVEASGDGTDTIESSSTYTLSNHVENLTLTGNSAIDGTGNTLDNIITGNSETNTLTGGLGNDTYVVQNTSDVIVENSGEGTDSVHAFATYTLSSYLEFLTLMGTTNINGTGNASNNTITGNIGNNILNGAGGADALIGGLGDDTYVIDNTDTLTENTDEGIDTVEADFNYTLLSNFENLTLTGSSGITGTGNSLDNTIIGNSGNNTLTSGSGNDRLDGGAGNDSMIGGQGDDTYVVDSASDTITENSSEGTDTVESYITITLGSNLENLTLIGTNAINGTGNSLNNILRGNSAINTLAGGLGNDTYIIDSADDIVSEAASAGTDTVYSSVTYTIGTNVEHLTLTGTGDTTAIGNTGNNTLTGNSGNNSLNGAAGTDTMIGGLGDDIYVVYESTDVVTEYADEGFDTVRSYVTRTLGDHQEKIWLNGSSNINATGNALDNVLVGNSGTNTLTGLAGNDTYEIDSTADTVVEAASAGIDHVIATITSNYTLTANVENLTLTGSNNINLTGNGLDNVITGNTGNNTINGGAGNDTMIGGLGNDIYVVDSLSDILVENESEGTDTVQTALTYILAENFENLTLTGSSAVNATGNSANNTLTGNTGNNVLDGGDGNDTMVGGTGNDTYYVDSVSDVVTEGSSAGTDTVYSSVTYTIGTNVEHLTLTGTGDTTAIGNAGNNTLIGNSGNNSLNGAAGTDTMIGGLGDDIYVVYESTDVVTEYANEGFDTVRSYVTRTLGDHQEKIWLNGSSNLNATGNALDNVLVGNSGTNTLTGLAGNDTYEIDSTADTVVEAASAGIDHVIATITSNYTLTANVENLTLMGTSSVNLTGNVLDNVITGNTGNNTISAGDGNDTLYGGDGNDVLNGGNNNDTLYGGAGTDTLNGGSGADTFVFEADSAFSNIDTISDFNTGQSDVLNIADLLTGYTSGVSDIDDFVSIGTSGGNSLVYVDRDGTGSTYSSAQIASLTGVTGLIVEDMLTNNYLVAA